MPASIQNRIAEFAATAGTGWARDDGRNTVLRALADTLAVSLAARHEPVVQHVLAYAQSLGEAGTAPAWVTSANFGPETTALVNSVAAHALDYDDVAPAWRGHASAVLFPALLALSNGGAHTGADIIDAYTVGFEVGARLGHACAQAQYAKGWHTTATIGIFAATAACARLLRLNPACGSAALGLAAAQAAGPQSNFGTMAKPLHAGFAAAAAVRAVRLAALGIQASSAALDGPRGFADLYGGDNSLDDAFRDLGDAPPILRGDSLERKAYPSCYAAHRGIEATLAICRAHPIDADAITAIEIEGSTGSHAALLKRSPRDAIEAKFSLEYAVSLVLLKHSIHLRSFTDHAFRRRDLRGLMALISIAEAAGPASPRYSRVRLKMRDGRTLENTVTGLGPDHDPSRIIAKTTDCLSFGGFAYNGQSFCAEIFALQDQPITNLNSMIRRWLGSATADVSNGHPYAHIASQFDI